MVCTVLCVVGTRPEIVKMAPIVKELRRHNSIFRCRLLATGQHRGLLDRALADFDLVADRDLDLMKPGQSLSELTARSLVAVEAAIGEESPDLVLAVGDTTTVLSAAMASHYRQIPFGHVEAGLRTGRRYFPFPEEKNREVVSRLASIHFAPTADARENLLREGIDAATVHLTGNPVIDALHESLKTGVASGVSRPQTPFVLVTAHRRENWGEPMRQIALGLRDLIDRNPQLRIVFSVHPNLEVRRPVVEILGTVERVDLIEPVGYHEFVSLLNACKLVITDSGGVQEEAPALGKRVLILRTETERPEVVASGFGRLIGPNRERIVAETEAIWSASGPDDVASLPFGDGFAAPRIVRAISQFFGLTPSSDWAELPEWPPRADAAP